MLTFLRYEQDNGGMRVGIQAPHHVNVVRKEIAEEGKKQAHMARFATNKE